MNTKELKEEIWKEITKIQKGCGREFSTLWNFGSYRKVKCGWIEEGFKPCLCSSCDTKYNLLEGHLEGYKQCIEMVEQLIDVGIKELKIEMRQYKEPEVNQFYARINELKELKKKLSAEVNK